MALLLTGRALSMPSMIGLIMLMGIVTKNSILLVDYAILAREGHLGPDGQPTVAPLGRFDALVGAWWGSVEGVVNGLCATDVFTVAHDGTELVATEVENQVVTARGQSQRA